MDTTDTYDRQRAEEIIRQLCRERGGTYGDGEPATESQIVDAATDPEKYCIDSADLAGACNGDVAAILRLRIAWRLPPFA